MKDDLPFPASSRSLQDAPAATDAGPARMPVTALVSQARYDDLLRRLELAEETLRAIQTGAVDAVVVEASGGPSVYTLAGADRPYRLFVEQMQQAACTLQADGTIAYCNRRALEMLGERSGGLSGRTVRDVVAPESRALFDALLAQGRGGIARGELYLIGASGEPIPTFVTFNSLPPDCGAAIGLLVTDLTVQKHREQLAAANTALRDSEAQSRRQAGQLAAFLETAAMGVHRLGPDGVVLWANEAELALLGYAREDYVGHRIHEFHEDPTLAAELLERLHRDERVHDCQARMRCRDGSTRDVLIDSSALREDGVFRHTQCFMRDITERVRAEERLRESEAHLREVDHRKNQFLAILSHELRNPLAPIVHATHLLRQQEMPDENGVQRRAREVIERQTSTLAKLVNDLLDIARLTTGRIQLQRETVDARTIVRHALETTAPQAEQRRHSIVAVMPAHPVWLRADPTRLEEVVVNLVGNAVKYTPPGGRIEVLVESDDRHGILRVRDSGVGIAPDVLPHVFEPFTQADQSLERSQGGLGIGLHVVKGLIELHGGSVGARSAGLGQGSEFFVRIPRAPAPQAPRAEAALRLESERGGVRVLVVDDNADSCTMLALFLQQLGYLVQTAHTGSAALELAESWHPAVVLLDIGLPGIDGCEVARRLRAQFPPDEMRLVAVTGYGRDQDIQRTRDAGFDTHLLKPIDPSAIDRLVVAWRAAQA
jgi:PAS domain S-box-containing protein